MPIFLASLYEDLELLLKLGVELEDIEINKTGSRKVFLKNWLNFKQRRGFKPLFFIYY